MYYGENEAFAGNGSEGLGQSNYLMQILKSQNPLAELRKALAAGAPVSIATMTDGGAFRIESLEATLKSLTYNEQSTSLANDLLQAKKRAESTVEEFATLDQVSRAFTYPEAGLSPTENDYYSRKYAIVKFIGAVGQVSNVFAQTRSLVPPMEAEKRRKALAIKRKLNELLYFGNSTNSITEPDGLLNNIVLAGLSNSNIIDLRGYRPTIEQFNIGVNQIENVSGIASQLRIYMSPNSYRNYMNELLANKRYIVGEGHAEVEGLKQNKLQYHGGEAAIRRDMFLNASNYSIRLDRTRTNPIASGDNAPNTPTLTSITQTAQGTSPYAPDPDTYDYAVVAVNQYGQMSAPLTAGLSGVVVGAASKVTIVVAEGGTSNASNVATAYQLQRRKTATPADNTTWQLVTTFASLTLVDDGTWLPGTDCMFMFEFDTDQVLAFHQLMDMALFPLGAIADAVRWFQRLYGTLIVYNPLKVICFKNVGSIPNA